MREEYIYPILEETLSLVEGVLYHVQISEGNPFVGILLRELRRECSPYNNNSIQEKLNEALDEVLRVEK